ncbi:putative modifying wall lignin-1/2 [Dioscorea sansibarensis]
MALSLPVFVLLSSLYLIAFVLAVGAERRRNAGEVVPDEYDERTFCVYGSGASTAYGLSAFVALLVSQVVVCGVTRCLCPRRGIASGGGGAGGGARACAVCSFVLSWLSFLGAEACLLAGSARNAYHTKYVGYYLKKDLTSCAALRKGVFAAAAALILISMATSLLTYWSHTRAETGGWVKHQNDVGVNMADHGAHNVEFSSTKI